MANYNEFDAETFIDEEIAAQELPEMDVEELEFAEDITDQDYYGLANAEQMQYGVSPGF